MYQSAKTGGEDSQGDTLAASDKDARYGPPPPPAPSDAHAPAPRLGVRLREAADPPPQKKHKTVAFFYVAKLLQDTNFKQRQKLRGEAVRTL